MTDPLKYWMTRSLELATEAAFRGEVPVGAVVVLDHEMGPAGVLMPVSHLGSLVAEGFNLKENSNIATHHAEVLAIENACKMLGRWRLSDCTLFVTLEPCLMCAGAIVQARFARVVFGARDPKAGALVSKYKIFETDGVNHRPQLVPDILSEACGEVLTRFFADRRNQ